MARILIIEDNPEVLDMLRLSLELEGYEVECAADGKKGMACFRSRPADLVITDIVMPEMDGIEIILELRRRDPQVKIIAISGSGKIPAELYLDSAERFGAVRAFLKPVDRKALLVAVKELLA